MDPTFHMNYVLTICSWRNEAKTAVHFFIDTLYALHPFLSLIQARLADCLQRDGVSFVCFVMFVDDIIGEHH